MPPMHAADTDHDTEHTATAPRADTDAGDQQPHRRLDDDNLPAAVEAVLLAVDRPLAASRIAAAVGLDATERATERVAALIETLNADYHRTGRSFRIETVAGGFRVMTLPDFAPAVAAVHGMQASSRLSRAAVETLAIIAYRQPITRADIEAIRGVACGEVLRGLLEKKLIAITGRAEELGRPMLYGTTNRFLEAFGLASLNDLPPIDDRTNPAAAFYQNEPQPLDAQHRDHDRADDQPERDTRVPTSTDTPHDAEPSTETDA